MALYEAQEKQVLFHSSTADEVLYGGAAGGGKSEAIIWDAVTFAMQNEKIKISIFRRTFPELEKSIILRFMEKIPIEWYKYNEQKKRVRFDNGSIMEFNHCQYEKDVYKFQSAEYDRMYFDELTHFSEWIYNYLLSRLRTTKKHIKPQVKSATNPGGIGHLWVKSKFIDDKIPGKLTYVVDPSSQQKRSTQFIPARVYDNKYIMQNDPSYIQRLMQLNEDDRKALLEGDWNVFKGQFFKEWREDVHVIEPFQIPKEWRKFRALDWGYRAPSAVVWMAIDFEGRIYVYRELYVSQYTDRMLCKTIKEMTPKEEKILYTIADPNLWSVTQFERGESIQSRFTKLGVPLIKGDNHRINGASAFRNYLQIDERDDKPTIFFFNTCYNCIKTIPALVFDEKRPEDVNTKGEDHCYDCVRYGIMAHPLSPNKKPLSVITNIFDRHFKTIRNKLDARHYIGGI